MLATVLWKSVASAMRLMSSPDGFLLLCSSRVDVDFAIADLNVGLPAIDIDVRIVQSLTKALPPFFPPLLASLRCILRSGLDAVLAVNVDSHITRIVRPFDANSTVCIKGSGFPGRVHRIDRDGRISHGLIDDGLLGDGLLGEGLLGEGLRGIGQIVVCLFAADHGGSADGHNPAKH